LAQMEIVSFLRRSLLALNELACAALDSWPVDVSGLGPSAELWDV